MIQLSLACLLVFGVANINDNQMALNIEIQAKKKPTTKTTYHKGTNKKKQSTKTEYQKNGKVAKKTVKNYNKKGLLTSQTVTTYHTNGKKKQVVKSDYKQVKINKKNKNIVIKKTTTNYNNKAVKLNQTVLTRHTNNQKKKETVTTFVKGKTSKGATRVVKDYNTKGKQTSTKYQDYNGKNWVKQPVKVTTLKVSNVSDNQASVEWATNQKVNKVDYYLVDKSARSVNQWVNASNKLGDKGSIKISNLKVNHEYEIQIRVKPENETNFITSGKKEILTRYNKNQAFNYIFNDFILNSNDWSVGTSKYDVQIRNYAKKMNIADTFVNEILRDQKESIAQCITSSLIRNKNYTDAQLKSRLQALGFSAKEADNAILNERKNTVFNLLMNDFILNNKDWRSGSAKYNVEISNYAKSKGISQNQIDYFLKTYKEGITNSIAFVLMNMYNYSDSQLLSRLQALGFTKNEANVAIENERNNYVFNLLFNDFILNRHDWSKGNASYKTELTNYAKAHNVSQTRIDYFFKIYTQSVCDSIADYLIGQHHYSFVQVSARLKALGFNDAQIKQALA